VHRDRTARAHVGGLADRVVQLRIRPGIEQRHDAIVFPLVEHRWHEPHAVAGAAALVLVYGYFHGFFPSTRANAGPFCSAPAAAAPGCPAVPAALCCYQLASASVFSQPRSVVVSQAIDSIGIACRHYASALAPSRHTRTFGTKAQRERFKLLRALSEAAITRLVGSAGYA
jgi:hypothetical protein